MCEGYASGQQKHNTNLLFAPTTAKTSMESDDLVGQKTWLRNRCVHAAHGRAQRAPRTPAPWDAGVWPLARRSRVLLGNIPAEVEAGANREAHGPAAIRQQIVEQVIVDQVGLRA